MRRTVAILALVLGLFVSPAFAADTYVNEWTTIPDAGTYTIKGSGINYEVSPGVYAPADPTITGNPTHWECATVSSPWTINKSNQTLTITRGGSSSAIQPEGIYWFRPSDFAITEAVSFQVPSVDQGATAITLTGVASGVDAEVVSQLEGIDWNYTFTNTTGWTANPYDPAASYLVVRYQLTSIGHTLTANGQAVDWGGTTTGQLEFEGASGGKFNIASTEAVDADGKMIEILYFLKTAQGKDWFYEGIPATWFASATLPVEIHYESKGGALTGPETWTAGTYYLASSVQTGGYALTWNPGVIAKVATDNTIIAVDVGTGYQQDSFTAECTSSNRCYIISCDDQTVGEDLSGEGLGCDSTVDDMFGRCVRAWNDTSIDNLVCAHFDRFGVDSYVWTGYAGALHNVTVQNSFFTSWGDYPDTCYAIRYAINSNGGGNNHTYKNNIIEMNGTNGKSWGIFLHSESSEVSNTLTVTNNLIVKTTHVALDDGGIYFHPPSGVYNLGTVQLRNNTVIDTTGGNSNGIDLGGWPTTNWSLTDNSTLGWDVGIYYSTVSPGFERTDNNAYGATTFNIYGLGGTGNTTLDPNYQTHVGGYFPSHISSSLYGYHILDSNTSLKDEGSRTAAAAGLDAGFHIQQDGVVDSGTVDIGFHYLGAGYAPLGIFGGHGIQLNGVFINK